MKKLTNLQFELILFVIIYTLLFAYLGYMGFGLFVIGIIIGVLFIEFLRKIFVKK